MLDVGSGSASCARRLQAPPGWMPGLALVDLSVVSARLRDPSNTQGDLREAFDRAGYTTITSHTLRRTVATLMDEAGADGESCGRSVGSRQGLDDDRSLLRPAQ